MEPEPAIGNSVNQSSIHVRQNHVRLGVSLRSPMETLWPVVIFG